MAFSRYEKRDKKISVIEKSITEDNEFANHYVSAKNVVDKTKLDFSYQEYQWKYGDKLYKIAHKFYGDPKLWWIIARINLKPTDSHYSIGDVLIIPKREQLNKILDMLGY